MWGWSGWTEKKQERSFLGDGNVLCHGYRDGYMGVYICEKSANSTLRMGDLLYANCISIEFAEGHMAGSIIFSVTSA